MGAVLTSINAFKQSLTGSAFEALAAATGDSLSILNYAPNSSASVEEIYAGNSASKMEVAVFSPRFGDNQYGLRLQSQFNPTTSGADGVPQRLLPEEIDIPIYSTDTLNVQVNGTASDNANVMLQLYYENVPGLSARLASWDAIRPLIMQANQGNSRTLAIEVTVTPGTTGNYGTSVALNANDDRLVANSDYALLGYTTDLPALMFGIRGPDTAFQRVPMPGHWDSSKSARWFIAQSKMRNSPRIPILSSNNKGTTLLDGISPTNVGATKVSLILAQLSQPYLG
jgi:hypothetical protein